MWAREAFLFLVHIFEVVLDSPLGFFLQLYIDYLKLVLQLIIISVQPFHRRVIQKLNSHLCKLAGRPKLVEWFTLLKEVLMTLFVQASENLIH